MIIKKQRYNDTQMTDTNSLAATLLQSPTKLSPVMVHLGGREDKKFPLSFLTEGMGNVKSIDTLEYEYDVMTRVTKTRPVAKTPSSTVNLGKGGKPFVLEFPDKWFIKDYVIISESMVQARIMSEPVRVGSGYEYTLQLVNPDPAAIMPAADVAASKMFGQLFAPVGTDWSRGNASNWASPARVKHRLTTIRKSYTFSGNAKDYVVEISLPTKTGTSNMWMDFEEWQRYLQWLEENESYLWYGQQSYNENGEVPMKDENNQPVVIGPGLLDQIIHKDTYSELTETKLKNVIADLFYGMTDAQKKEVTLFTGTGGAREFDEAMKKHIGATNYKVFNDGTFVTGSGRNLTVTGYFTTYEHIDGHIVRIVKVPLFDHGVVAQTRAKHPKTGYSLESYRMVFVDQSMYEGQRNVQMITKKGRELIRWAVPGSVVPRGFDQSTSRASDIDGASVHFLCTKGICLLRFDTSLDLSCVAS